MSKEILSWPSVFLTGRLFKMFPDGTTRPFPADETDWSALRSMSDGEINAAALNDPDNPPWSRQRQAHLRRVPKQM
jgi:hypothetical protein